MVGCIVLYCLDTRLHKHPHFSQKDVFAAASEYRVGKKPKLIINIWNSQEIVQKISRDLFSIGENSS